MPKKYLILTVAVLILGFLGYKKFWPKPPQAIYELAEAGYQDIRQTVTASGKIKSATQADLKFQTAGQLAWVKAKTGDRVKKWQALAGLDQRALKKTLQKYLLDFSKERNDFDEARQVTYRDTVLTDTISRILQKNQYDLDKAVLDVELQDIALKYATLVAPFDGVIVSTDIPVAGINILSTTPIVTAADPDNLIFEAEIDEQDVGLVKTGQPAVIALDAYPDKPLTVPVDSIDFMSRLDSSGSTVFIAKFKFKNSASQPLLLGMNGEAVITVNEKNHVLAVPVNAVSENGRAEVQTVTGRQLISQPVTPGISDNSFTEITAGLQPGQVVVVAKKR